MAEARCASENVGLDYPRGALTILRCVARCSRSLLWFRCTRRLRARCALRPRQKAPGHFEQRCDRVRRREMGVHRELGDLLRQRPSARGPAPQNRQRVAAALHVAVLEAHVEHRFFAGFPRAHGASANASRTARSVAKQPKRSGSRWKACGSILCAALACVQQRVAGFYPGGMVAPRPGLEPGTHGFTVRCPRAPPGCLRDPALYQYEALSAYATTYR